MNLAHPIFICCLFARGHALRATPVEQGGADQAPHATSAVHRERLDRIIDVEPAPEHARRRAPHHQSQLRHSDNSSLIRACQAYLTMRLFAFMYTIPPMNPITIADHDMTLPQLAVMDTRPPRQPPHLRALR